jgi:O-antigen/teichoic acid export membrane protein
MLVLIPRYSITGAAIAVGIGNALGALVGYAIAVRKFGVDIGSCFIVRSSDIKYVLQSFMPQ